MVRRHPRVWALPPNHAPRIVQQEGPATPGAGGVDTQSPTARGHPRAAEVRRDASPPPPPEAAAQLVACDRGVVWCSAVPCSIVECGVIRRGVVWRDVLRCGAVWRCMMRYGTV